MKKNKGIILAGGSGTRLYPLTIGFSKQLLPIYDKPMIYYPLSVLMLADIKEILIITTSSDLKLFKKLIGDGSYFGLNISYKIQEKPNGIGEAFLIGEKFIGKDNVTLILGDNIFFGQNFIDYLQRAKKNLQGATVFAQYVTNPDRYGVVYFDANGKVKSIIEKPKKPKSNYAITGLYFYDNNVINYAKKIKPSKRGELEITDINNCYLNDKKLNVEVFSRGFSWMDTGNADSMLEASTLIKTIEMRHGLKIACLEEIAFKKKWITKKKLLKRISIMGFGNYNNYVKQLLIDE